MSGSWCALWAPVSLCLALLASPAVARQDYGIDFVTVGAPGNQPFPGPDPFPFAPGRGQVNYEYRIGRTEITTAQWMQFVNTFSQGGEPDGFALPTRWGAVEDPNYHGPGRQYILNPGHPNAGMQPVFGLTWRESAQYCNWLCNNQSSDPISLTNGAYDTSTFTYNPGGTFNDQLTHNPGSRFWIPTFDEWIKAAHYDPNRNGPGQSGWWQFDTSSDVAPVPGAPGVGQTSAGYILPGDGAMDIPLGSYPSTLSPWGLLDTSGGTSEWTEETFFNVYGQNRWRWADGSVAGRVAGLERDRVGQGALDIPEFMGWDGLRIASAVPSPSAGALWGGSCVAVLMRRTRPR